MAKKILFFTGGSYVSGMEIITLHLMSCLKDQGYDVRCIFSGWNDGKFKIKLDEIGIKNYEVKLGWIYLTKPSWTLDTLLNYPKALRTCKKILKDYNPDICQYSGFPMTILLYKLISPNSIYSLHETHLPNKKHNLIYYLLNKKIRYFTGVSKHIVHVLEDLKITPNKIKLVYNGIDFPKNLPNSEPSIKVNSEIRFAIIGQVVAWKGHQLLIEAVENLIKKDVKNIKVLIYGNDKTVYAKELKSNIVNKGISNYFEWKGFVDNQNIIYDNCDVVVVPSLSAEPCSLTIIEAMAKGKAIIASDRGGNTELIKNGINGLICRNNSPASLTDCMNNLINNKLKILDLGKAAQSDANINYTKEIMTANYIKIYDTLSMPLS